MPDDESLLKEFYKQRINPTGEMPDLESLPECEKDRMRNTLSFALFKVGVARDIFWKNLLDQLRRFKPLRNRH